MALGTKKNIIVGAATVYLGPAWDTVTGTDPAPTYPASATAGTYKALVDAAANWANVGFTQDGVEVATDPSWTDIDVDQLLDAAKIFQDGMGLSITTTFAESTLDNLLIAWGQAASTISSTATDKSLDIAGGALGASPNERGLIAIGNSVEKPTANGYGERTYRAYRVLSVEAVSHTLARADATVIPVTFRALPGDNGKYGVVRDKYNTP